MATKDISDKQVCQVYADTHPIWESEIYPYDLLMERTGQPFKVCYRAMERAYGRQYIECGVSLRTGWLTAKGQKLLEEGQ